MRTLTLLFVTWVAFLPACSDSHEAGLQYTPVAGTVTPSDVSSFGYEKLTVVSDVPVFKPDAHITIGGNEVYDVTIVSQTEAEFFWQGSPDQAASIDVVAGGKTYRFEDALTVRPPPHPAFERMLGIGASFGQGVMSMGFDQDTQIYAPSAQIARQAGNYFPLPLTKRGYIPFIMPDDFDANCRDDAYQDDLVRRINDALAGFRTTEAGTSPRGLRIDADIEVQNASVGGSTLKAAVRGAENADLAVITFLEHLVYDGDVDWEGMIRSPEIGSQLDYAVAFKPTMVVTIDIAGNDVLPALDSDGFHADDMPDDAYFHEFYGELFERLGPDVWVFIADLPDITLIPDSVERRRKLIASGRTTEAVDAEIGEVRARLAEINQILKQEAEAYPRVVIIPFSKRLDEMANEGLTIGGVDFSVKNFGGFISLDTLHLTRVGYAVISNVFIEHINVALGTTIPLVDLEAVAKIEPETPDKLAAYGLTPENCGE